MKINPVQAQTIQPAKKHSAAKKAAGALLATAAVTGGVLYMAKSGKLNPKEGGNVVIEKAKSALKKPADYLLKKGAKAKEAVAAFAEKNPKVGEVLGKTGEKVSAVKNAVSEKAGTVKDTVGQKFSEVKSAISKKLSTAADFVESKFHPEKFQ